MYHQYKEGKKKTGIIALRVIISLKELGTNRIPDTTDWVKEKILSVMGVWREAEWLTRGLEAEILQWKWPQHLRWKHSNCNKQKNFFNMNTLGLYPKDLNFIISEVRVVGNLGLET